MDREIRDLVAIHVTVDIRVALRLLVAQLSGLSAKRLRPDEGEHLIPALCRAGVDSGEVDLVFLLCREIEDSIASGARDGRFID